MNSLPFNFNNFRLEIAYLHTDLFFNNVRHSRTNLNNNFLFFIAINLAIFGDYLNQSFSYDFIKAYAVIELNFPDVFNEELFLHPVTKPDLSQFKQIGAYLVAYETAVTLELNLIVWTALDVANRDCFHFVVHDGVEYKLHILTLPRQEKPAQGKNVEDLVDRKVLHFILKEIPLVAETHFTHILDFDGHLFSGFAED